VKEIMADDDDYVRLYLSSYM